LRAGGICPGTGANAAVFSTPPFRLPLIALLLSAAAGCGMVAQNRNADGLRHFNRGQLAVAQARFEAAKQANPQNADAYYNLGAVAHLQGVQTRNTAQLGQAESLYRQCLAYNPNHVDCHRGLAVLLAQTQRVDQAFELMKNWTVTSPQSADARVELARLYEEYGDLRTAELQLQQALQLDLNNSRVHASLGSVKEKMGDLPQALANYQRSYTLNTFQPGVPERIATLQQRVGSSPATNLAPASTGPLRSAGAAGFQNRNY
jgi:tetratricopeptide (TPR) repeat protein